MNNDEYPEAGAIQGPLSRICFFANISSEAVSQEQKLSTVPAGTVRSLGVGL